MSCLIFFFCVDLKKDDANEVRKKLKLKKPSIMTDPKRPAGFG